MQGRSEGPGGGMWEARIDGSCSDDELHGDVMTPEGDCNAHES